MNKTLKEKEVYNLGFALDKLFFEKMPGVTKNENATATETKRGLTTALDVANFAGMPSIKTSGNINPALGQEIGKILGLNFTPEKESESEVCFANNTDLRQSTGKALDLQIY